MCNMLFLQISDAPTPGVPPVICLSQGILQHQFEPGDLPTYLENP